MVSTLTWMIFASSSLSSTGNDSVTWRQDAGVGSSRLRSGPIDVDSEVTSSSRIASSGGFVTWANSCEK